MSDRTLPTGLRAFRHRNFRLFYGGQAISLVGTWMQQVAQGWLVLQLTNDAFALGLVAAAQFLPVMFLGLFGGVAADAIPKRTGLIVTQSVSGLLALVLGVLVVTGHVQVWQVILLALALGVVNAFDMPIRQSFVVEMVGREDIASAVGFNSALFNGTRIIGPAVAGLLIAVVGVAPCFFLNAASFLAVVASLLLMRLDELFTHVRPHRPGSAREIGTQLREGLAYVRATPVILLAVCLVGVVSMTALNNQVLLPLTATDLLDGGAATYGFLGAASGVGSLISALAIAFGQKPTLRLLITGAAALGLSMVLLGLSRSLPASLLIMVLAGWGLIAMAATTNTTIQLAVPDELRGRVMSVYTTIFAGASPIGAILAGTIAATWGVSVALQLGGLVALIAVGVAVLLVKRSPRISLSTVGAGALDRPVPPDRPAEGARP
ncbi:MAG: MFS transporter [Chloroflexota bacterium]